MPAKPLYLSIDKLDAVVGAGSIFFSRRVNEIYGGELYLGDSQSMTLNSEQEKITVKTGDGEVGTNLIDKVITTNRSGTFVIQTMTNDCFSLWLGGETSTSSDTAVAVTDETFTVSPGYWYTLGKTADKPLGIGQFTASTLVVSNSTNVAYTLTDDYRADADRGIIYIVPGGSISADTEIKVDYTPVANTRDIINVDTTQQVEGQLIYRENSITGTGNDIVFRLVTLVPDAALSLKSRDTIQQMSFMFTVLRSPDEYPEMTVGGIIAP